jgi:predicted transposase/invertase (TIGR01784 family)
MSEKYVNPFTDFGFKKIFGEEANKELLIDFLNELLPAEQGKITNLTYIKSEQLGASATDRKAVFDLYCYTDNGGRCIVELQKVKQKYFKDRSLYYASFALQEQGQRGEWDYKIEPVYTISIMDFVFDDHDPSPSLRHDVRLIDVSTQRVFTDKLQFIYLEMPRFKKGPDELDTRFDKWLYVLKNLPFLERVPEKLREGLFMRLFEVAEVARFNEDDRRAYYNSVKVYRDMKNAIDTAVEEAVEVAVAEAVARVTAETAARVEAETAARVEAETAARVEAETAARVEAESRRTVAQSLIALGLDNATIQQATQLTAADIERLRQQ